VNALFDLAVLGRVDDVAAVAGAAGRLLASRSPSRSALVVTVGPSGAGPRVAAAPASAAARGLRSRLDARDLPARAAGRIVWCCLGGSGARADARRAAATGAPAILAVCVARPTWIESLLDDTELILVASAPGDPVTAIVLAGLERRGLRSAAVEPPSGLGAVIARAGLRGPSTWSPRLTAALEERA
jgi:hypothetical protein